MITIFSTSLAHNLTSKMPQNRRVTLKDAYAGGQKGQLLPLPSSLGARMALYTEQFPPLLSYEGEFCDIVDSLVQENSSGGKPPT